MAQPTDNYIRLRGRGRGLFRTSELWLAPDHLLCVDSDGFTESYKRFYFADIQAILTRKTITWIVVASVIGAFACFFGVLTLAVSDDDLRIFFGVLSGICCCILVLYLATGSTCVSHVKTAVQVEELPTLSRHRTIHKVLEKVRPLILVAQSGQVAQSGLTAEQIKAQTAEIWKAITFYNGRYHDVLFATFLLSAVLSAVYLAHPTDHWAMITLSGFVIVALLICFICGLRRQGHSDLPAGLRKFTWACLIYSLVGLCATIAVSATLAVTDPSFLSAPSATHPTARITYASSVALDAPIGLVGLIWLARFRRSRKIARARDPMAATN